MQAAIAPVSNAGNLQQHLGSSAADLARLMKQRADVADLLQQHD